MDYVYYIYNNVKYFYNSMNPATLSGAIDVIVVEQPDGSLLSTPFHVRFGKYGVFNFEDKYVDIAINGEEIDLKMKLGENGVAFFLEEEEEEGKDQEGQQRPARDLKEIMDSKPDSPESGYGETPILADPGEETPTASSSTDGGDESSPNAKTEKRATPPSGAVRRPRIQTMAQQNKPVGQPQLQQNQFTSQQQRQKLAFSSSIYSCRRNRSLPDLANLASWEGAKKGQNGQEGGGEKEVGAVQHENNEEEEERTGKKAGGDRLNMLRRTGQGQHTLKHTRSASTALKNYDPKCDADFIGESNPNSTYQQQQMPFGNSDKNDDGEEGGTGGGIEMKMCPPGLTDDDIADGALSDSEVERHRKITPHIKEPEWKWGEIPKSKEDTKADADKHAADEMKTSRWNYWFGRWSSRRQKDINHGEEQIEGAGGVPLQEIGKDPAKLELYMGVPMPNRTEPLSISSKSSDSGQGPSLGTSPLSLSEETLIPAAELVNHDAPCSSNSMDVEVVVIAKTEPKRRSLRLSSQQLELLNLDYGSNDARFSITTRYQGTAWCSCHIYLLRWFDKLVVSDIDGTITKSDVLGHVIPAIGGTWAHSGVAELYTGIKRNGYQMVYLSSRAIGQSHYTKTYLQNFAQGSRTLPDGPVLLSPSSVLMAFRKEVIERKPEEFKIACLTDLASLFPVGQPFFAGFGNRDTDVKSYRAVGIPPERIMIIDPQGRLRRADNKLGGYVSDYATMAMNSVDFVFPPRRASVDNDDGGRREQDKVSEFLAWRTDPQQFDNLVDAELEAYKERGRAASNSWKNSAGGGGGSRRNSKETDQQKKRGK